MSTITRSKTEEKLDQILSKREGEDLKNSLTKKLNQK